MLILLAFIVWLSHEADAGDYGNYFTTCIEIAIAKFKKQDCESVHRDSFSSDMSAKEREVLESYIKSIKGHNNSSYGVDRKLNEYYPTSSNSFPRAFINLKAGDTWFDLGAGTARALRTLKDSLDRGIIHENDPQMVRQLVERSEPFWLNLYAFGLYKPLFYPKIAKTTDIIQSSVPRLKSHFQYIAGPFESANLDHLPEPNIITDHWGVISYTPQLSSTLEKAINALDVDGNFFIGKDVSERNLILVDGDNLGLSDWLNTIPGVESHTEISTDENRPWRDEIICIKRLKDHKLPIHIPRLILYKFEDSFPATRYYRVSDR